MGDILKGDDYHLLTLHPAQKECIFPVLISSNNLLITKLNIINKYNNSQVIVTMKWVITFRRPGFTIVSGSHGLERSCDPVPDINTPLSI